MSSMESNHIYKSWRMQVTLAASGPRLSLNSQVGKENYFKNTGVLHRGWQS
jgi:hypothetical protein